MKQNSYGPDRKLTAEEECRNLCKFYPVHVDKLAMFQVGKSM